MTKLHQPLGELAEFINGVAFRPEDWGDKGTKIVRIQNLTDATKPYNRTTRRVDPKYIVQKDDLLVSWSASLGVFPWIDEEPALVNQHIFKVVPKAKLVDKAYLRHALEGALSDMERHLHGATMQHVNRAEFLGTQIPLPSLEEQRRIAAILDQAEALRVKRRQAIAKLDTLTQSLFIEMFGDPITNPKRWDYQRLEDMTSKVTDGEHLNPKFSDVGMPIVMAGNVLDDVVDIASAKRVDAEMGERFRRKCRPESGDLLLVSRGATIGRICCLKTTETFCLMGSVILIKPIKSRIDPVYLSTLLKHPAMKSTLYKTSGSSAQQAIYLKDLKGMKYLVPPLNLQIEFSRQVHTIGSSEAVQRLSRSELEDLSASLQFRAFRGEL